MAQEMIAAGVIGVGNMGQHHARIYAELPQCRLIGIYDPDIQQAERIAYQYRCEAFPTLEALLSAPIEAVSIAVPTSLHKEIAIKALNHHLHVLLEKPLAGTPEEGKAIREVAYHTGRQCMVGHVERFNPVVHTIKQILEDEPTLALNITRVGPRPPRIKDSGVIIDMAIHDIDLVRFLLQDEVEAIFCVTSSTDTSFEDAASILMRTRKGTAVQLTTNWITPYKAREIQLTTASRIIKADLLNRQVREFRKFSTDSCLVAHHPVSYNEPLRLEIEAFLQAISTGGPVPVSVDDGLTALQIATEAIQAATYYSSAANF